MDKRKENVKQHFIPQFYLKDFSLDRKNINVFDVKRGLEYKRSIKTTGYKKLFYDIDPSLFAAFYKNSISSAQLVDRQVRLNIEEKISPVLKGFLELSNYLVNVGHLDLIKLGEEILPEIINYIVIQFIRTPKFRRNFEDFGRDLRHLVNQHNFPFEHNKNYWTSFIHNKFIYEVVLHCILKEEIPFRDKVDTEVFFEMIYDVDKFIDRIHKSGRMFFFNDTDKPFITSDCPVSIMGNDDFKEFNLMFFPINRNIGILFFNIDEFPQLFKYDHSIRYTGMDLKGIIDNLNLFTTSHVFELIYSHKYDFTMEKKFINGEIKMKLFV